MYKVICIKLTLKLKNTHIFLFLIFIFKTHCVNITIKDRYCPSGLHIQTIYLA